MKPFVSHFWPIACIAALRCTSDNSTLLVCMHLFVMCFKTSIILQGWAGHCLWWIVELQV